MKSVMEDERREIVTQERMGKRTLLLEGKRDQHCREGNGFHG